MPLPLSFTHSFALFLCFDPPNLCIYLQEEVAYVEPDDELSEKITQQVGCSTIQFNTAGYNIQ